MMLSCSRHGVTIFRLKNNRGYRCIKCEGEAVSRRRRKVKRILVEEAGGACRICGYSRCVAALEFHHTNPADKSFSLSHRGVCRSLAKARDEARKCVLLFCELPRRGRGRIDHACRERKAYPTIRRVLG
jgi:hypothetical protein